MYLHEAVLKSLKDGRKIRRTSWITLTKLIVQYNKIYDARFEGLEEIAIIPYGFKASELIASDWEIVPELPLTTEEKECLINLEKIENSNISYIKKIQNGFKKDITISFDNGAFIEWGQPGERNTLYDKLEDNVVYERDALGLC